LKELHPTQNNFLIYLKHIHLLENKTPSNTKNGGLFYPRLIRSPEPLVNKKKKRKERGNWLFTFREIRRKEEKRREKKEKKGKRCKQACK